MRPILLILTCILLLSTAGLAQTNRSLNGNDPNVVKLVRFYPNPATSFINFEFQNNNLSTYSFKVYNFIGKKILEINTLTPRTVVNLSDYFRGVYIFQLTDRSGKIIESGKFQVVK